jgi:hypothetical protein
MIESEKEKDKGKKIETEEEETEEEETEEEEIEEEEIEEEETEEEEDDKEKIEEKGGKIRKKEHPFPNFVKEMGRNLNVLLHNINKLPTPPPTNDINKVSKHNYRSALIKHLAEIESNDEFLYQTEIFANIGYKKKSRKGSLSFILYDEKEEEEEDNDQKMVDVHDVENISDYQIIIKPDDILINRDVVTQLNNPGSLLTLSEEEFESQKDLTCAIISNIIIRIYDMSLKDQITSEIIRRRRFRYLILFLTYYEKLEIFCSIHRERGKGSTIKNQAIKMIVKSSKPSQQDTAKIKHTTVTTLLNKATRIKRLLNIALDNYNIFDAFPDLEPEFFSTKKLNVINYERWLKLVETGNLISFDEGSQLYKNYKASAKEERKLNLDKIHNI